MSMIFNVDNVIKPKLDGLEELDGLAVSALGVRSRKLSTGINGQSWDG
jgi:hypothetical protein